MLWQRSCGTLVSTECHQRIDGKPGELGAFPGSRLAQLPGRSAAKMLENSVEITDRRAARVIARGSLIGAPQELAFLAAFNRPCSTAPLTMERRSPFNH